MGADATFLLGARSGSPRRSGLGYFALFFGRWELTADTHRRTRRIAVVALLSLSAVAVNAAAAGPVAVVGSTPISLQSYAHWAKVERHAYPHKSAPSRRGEVMDFLISNTWVEVEAAAEGIVVTQQEVDQEFARIRRANYKTEAQFRRFLRQAGETVADIKYRTRIELLSERLQARGSVFDLAAKWKPQTRCAPAYSASDCGGHL